MTSRMLTDAFGRTVTVVGTQYVVTDGTGISLTVEAISDGAALTTINAMAPLGWSPPPAGAPETISALAFLQRFTPAEQAAVWQAAVSNPEIGVGLQTGLATGHITLTDPVVQAWMASLVTATALTSVRSATILTP